MKPKSYIGLAISPHDPALAIVNSKGQVVFAEAAERYLQIKRAWNSSPEEVVRMEKLLENWCDPTAELVIATSWSKRHQRCSRFQRNLVMPLIRRFLPAEAYGIMKMIHNSFLANFEFAGSNIILQQLNRNPGAKITQKFYNHHLTHAVAACHASSFDQALCAVVDGGGEFSSTAFYRYDQGKITKLPIKPSKHASLGVFYDIICLGCGFDPLKGEAWKVMGLAPYGKLSPKFYKLLHSYMRIENGVIVPEKSSSMNTMFMDLSKIKRPAGTSPMESADLAYTGQLVFSELMTDLLNDLHRIAPGENLILSGGCALNSAFNGLLLEKTPFKRLSVFSAPADDGNAMGAALQAYYEEHPPVPSGGFCSPYLGETISLESLDRLERFGNIETLNLPWEELCKMTAHLLARGKIIGWVQGRAEYGPRALGNRSILADPRSSAIKNRLNLEVKFREEFRPFSPAIIDEDGHAYFENYVESPYMERALRFRKEVRDKIPGVVHVDGTGRLQTVKRQWNRKFYDLLTAFKEQTNIPILLNTSFNVMGKPIIHTIEDALGVFFTSGMDGLVIENRLFLKPDTIKNDL